ncbi:serine protease nudel [Calliopsis andreniformis]|uniref:serine protease nudel n=1 Tax=Calliopsis andreniformis TaxID=337506 RepID=UPI003FCEA518
MDSEYKISTSNLENLPIINAECCENFRDPQHTFLVSLITYILIGRNKFDPEINTKCIKPVKVSSWWKLYKYYKLMFVSEILIGIFILCAIASVLYMTLTSESIKKFLKDEFHSIMYYANSYLLYRAKQREESFQEQTEINKPLPDKQTDEWNQRNMYKIVYDDRLSPEWQTILSELQENRLKRDADLTACQDIMDLCQKVIDSTWRIANLVNSSMPHLQHFLESFSATSPESKSQFMELVKCLQCKNMITFINASAPENNHLMMNEDTDNKIKNNINIISTLLNNDKLDSEKKYSDSSFTERPNIENIKYNQNSATVSVFNEPQNKRSNQTTEGQDTNFEATRTTEYKLMFAEVKTINTVTNVPMIPEAEGAANQTIRIDDMEQTVITLNTTAKPDRGNVMEIVNDVVHPPMHPSDEGLAEQSEPKGEADNGRCIIYYVLTILIFLYTTDYIPSKYEINPKDARKSVLSQNSKRRIVSNNHFQAKGNLDTAQGIIPTAETIKSTQQLQLTPTMSWMPYQVCFYGPPPNGGPMKQSAPGQMMYPPSSPGVPYPLSMPQQRQGPQNSANQSPNYVQVQAQSVQFLPMQPYQGNPGVPVNQRLGPTGPGMQNMPTYPGFQPSPSGGAGGFGGSGKSPYYCTYIPAPTFQFPAIPGVSEYQRSASSEKNDTQNVDGEGSFIPCPFNSIQCRNSGKCILRSQWCDGQVDCSDASDETSCSCRDRIAQERLCDGYFDCPHGEDELGCLGCPKTEFSCNDWSKRYTTDNCVPLSQRCDGVKQCANGKDEMDCNILTPTYIEGKNVFTVGYTEGYLHKNYMGQWYPVCTAVDSWAKDACISEIGPDMNGEPDIKIHSIPDNVYQGPYLAEIQDEIKLIPSCMNTAVYVRCPPFPCGTRVFSSQDSLLRPFVLENEGRDTLPYFDSSSQMVSKNKTDKENEEQTTKGDDIVGSQLRVVGGRASQPKAWPFLVTIYKDGKFYCGGVILNEMWILTAAHCLDGYMSHYYEIHAGLLRRLSFSPMAQSRKARQTIIYPQYNSKELSNDIGMIMLDEPLRFNRWVRPVCLPGADILGDMWRLKPEANSTCIAIGWGAMKERGPDPDHLREVEVPILEKCKYESDQNEATICAGYPQGGRDACQGDSGGPLMCRNPYSESQWYVAGIVSHGEGCARPNEPGTYTKVSYFLNWIQEISSGRGMPPLKRIPLEKCPGFSCEGGLGRCLPIESRCNQVVDCLDGEDEVNCYSHLDYSLYIQRNRPDPKFEIELLTNITSVAPEMPSSNEWSREFTQIYTTLSMDNTDTTTESLPTSMEPVTTFTCTRLLQSISINRKCDRVVDCEDSTDELNCTCKDYLLNLKPTAICNGYIDCDDKTDEEDCDICSEDEFHCRNSRKCIPKSKKCDFVSDCEFHEDEIDCFSLTNGQTVYLDADERPFFNTQGVLTQYTAGKWQPTCHYPRIHQNQSTTTLIGQKICEYFGFANLLSADSTTVKDSQLETIPWDKEDTTLQGDPSTTFRNDKNKTCPGLYIRCRPVFNSSLSAHLTVDADTGSRDYFWPWLAAIFVDGSYRCTAILLDTNWLLSAAKCVENVKLNKNYTTAVLGYGPLYRYVDGPHQQVSMIDEVQYVNNSVSVLLHLNVPVNITRHVRPLFLEKKIYPPRVNDTCVAIQTDENYQTKSVFLKPVLENCQSCHRCFVNPFALECSKNVTSNSSGIIFCYGIKGWYPAATFQNQDSPCDFRNTKTLTSIDQINPYLTEAIDGARSPVKATCHGFRCNLGQCIPLDRVCDGVADCRDHGDEDPKYCSRIQEQCENSVEGCSCTRSQMRCGTGKCVDKSAFCDRNVDCPDGSDEPSMCTCADYLKLSAPERLCDGVRHCLDKTDESPEFCPCRNSSFKCNTVKGDHLCIPQNFICDGDWDCLNGEDEAVCTKLKQPLDGSGAGEVIQRSYGVWHSMCFSSPITPEEASDVCKKMGYSSGSANNNTEITGDPMIPKLNNFYIVRLNDWKWMALRDDKPFITLVKPDDNCYRASVNCI